MKTSFVHHQFVSLLGIFSALFLGTCTAAESTGSQETILLMPIAAKGPEQAQTSECGDAAGAAVDVVDETLGSAQNENPRVSEAAQQRKRVVRIANSDDHIEVIESANNRRAPRPYIARTWQSVAARARKAQENAKKPVHWKDLTLTVRCLMILSMVGGICILFLTAYNAWVIFGDSRQKCNCISSAGQGSHQ